VEICPIYGAKGYESRFITYLSPKWMEMFGATTQIASKLGIGVDLTMGTGWPMGGPWIPTDMASESVSIERYPLGPDGKLPRQFGAPAHAAGPGVPTDANGVVRMDGMLGGSSGKLLCLKAVGPDGIQTDLTDRAKEGPVDWTAPGPGWKVYALTARQPVQKVKRAAPGGEGNVVDPYSLKAMDAYLSRFQEAFQTYGGAPPRAEFQDSFEYFGANWTPDFFNAFAARRGYDLREHLHELYGDGDADVAARVREDYRRTIGELHEAYVAHWTEWSHAHGSLTREQAHGAPANIEDVYAATDIAETEGAFGGGTDDQVPMMKFASSAAHTTGKALASSETFTWLGEHFQVPLSRMKPIVDRFYLAGINHIFFQGIPYSPSDAQWPGWLFYASVNFGPNGGIWHDLPAFNAYATRCQSILQSGKPDGDLLLYFPVADFWQKSGPPPGARASGGRPGRPPAPDPLVQQFSTPGLWMLGSRFQALAMELWSKGYSYDAFTDELLMKAQVERTAADLPGGPVRISLGGNSYGAIVIPSCRYIPVETLRKLFDLARAGATIVFEGNIPSDVPGLGNLDVRRGELRKLLEEAPIMEGTARIGAGRIWVGGAAGKPDDSLLSAIAAFGIPRERMTDVGLQYVRRKQEGGYDYFIVNKGSTVVDTWVPLSRNAASAALFDPLAPDRVGVAATRPAKDGLDVYLQLSPGDSIILRTYAHSAPDGAAWQYLRTDTQAPRTLTGEWSVHFTEGGPVLPKDFQASELASWTDRDDPEAKRFAGTAVYRLSFDMPADSSVPGGLAAKQWRLDLGVVADSARVRLNGTDVTTLWCAPFSADVGRFLHAGANVLEVEVTNVAANRIRDLDQRHVAWKNFYEINFVNASYRSFDASGWPIRPSGLIGPVTLAPRTVVIPN
jgi:hypothetical protein